MVVENTCDAILSSFDPHSKALPDLVGSPALARDCCGLACRARA
jgi:hypothetical protein